MPPNPYLKALGGQTGAGETTSPASKTKSKKTKKDSTSAKGQSTTQKDETGLRKEILALGGDEEDYKMLQGVESDSELEESGEDEAEVGGKQAKGGKPAVRRRSSVAR
jgi:ribosome biogenesis protein MAK21